VVLFPAGDTTDILARSVAQALGEKYPAMRTTQTESATMARFVLCRPVPDPFAHQLAERRGFQPLSTSSSARRSTAIVAGS